MKQNDEDHHKNEFTFPFLSLWIFCILVVIPLSVYLKQNGGFQGFAQLNLTAPNYL